MISRVNSLYYIFSIDVDKSVTSFASLFCTTTFLENDENTQE